MKARKCTAEIEPLHHPRTDGQQEGYCVSSQPRSGSPADMRTSGVKTGESYMTAVTHTRCEGDLLTVRNYREQRAGYDGDELVYDSHSLGTFASLRQEYRQVYVT